MQHTEGKIETKGDLLSIGLDIDNDNDTLPRNYAPY